jgi:hypothetical protein
VGGEGEGEEVIRAKDDDEDVGKPAIKEEEEEEG